MKKDYMPVSEAATSEDETTFVANHWTDHWEGSDLQYTAENWVESHEQFSLIKPYISRLNKGARILDGGCGLGGWTVYYTSKGFDTIGLDISRKTVDRLRDGIPDCKFELGDIRQTNFENSHFDAYLSWGTFEHFESGLGTCFKEANRILKPGGYLFISVPYQNGRHLRRDKGPLSNWDEQFEKTAGYKSDMRFYQWRLTKRELEREFELGGFEGLEFHTISKAVGVQRAIRHDLHLSPGTYLSRVANAALLRLVPASYVAHMILGIGRKR